MQKTCPPIDGSKTDAARTGESRGISKNRSRVVSFDGFQAGDVLLWKAPVLGPFHDQFEILRRRTVPTFAFRLLRTAIRPDGQGRLVAILVVNHQLDTFVDVVRA